MYKTFEKLLLDNKKTAYWVSKNTGIPGSTFSDWKKGKSKPKYKKIKKIADCLGVEPEVLMEGDD